MSPIRQRRDPSHERGEADALPHTPTPGVANPPQSVARRCRSPRPLAEEAALTMTFANSSCRTQVAGLRSCEIRERRPAILVLRGPSNADNSAPDEDSSAAPGSKCIDVARCTLPGSGIRRARSELQRTEHSTTRRMRPDCHAAAIHERAVLRSFRRV